MLCDVTERATAISQLSHIKSSTADPNGRYQKDTAIPLVKFHEATRILGMSCSFQSLVREVC
jgi:hypothetical protein